MQSRRAFLRDLFLSFGILAFGAADGAELPVFQGRDKFNSIIQKALANNWVSLPIGDLMGMIAREFLGTPYKGGTLEISADQEVCSANLMVLDCVTFFETTLDLARMLKTGGRTESKLLAQINFTRYRGGTITDYSSRLHYTTDWFVDNQKKHVVQLLSHLPGSQPFTQKVGFMTSHPDLYPAFAKHPLLIPKMKQHEDLINQSTLTYVPMNKLHLAEPLLKTGDIVGVCTTETGLDIAHTGLVLRDKDGVAHFMDASSKKGVMKVVIEPGQISHAFTWSKKLTGAMFARPLEPRSNFS